MGFLAPALGIVSMVTSLAGGAVGMTGAKTQAAGSEELGAAQATQALYQAQVARNNAKTAKQNSAWSMEAGDVAAGNEMMKTKAAIGTAKADQGASNVDVNSGSALTSRVGIDEMGTENALTIRSNAAKEAYGYKVQGTSDTAEAGLLTQQAAYAKEAGSIGAESALIGGESSLLASASSVASNWSKWQTQYGSPMGGSGGGYQSGDMY